MAPSVNQNADKPPSAECLNFLPNDRKIPQPWRTGITGIEPAIGFPLCVWWRKPDGTQTGCGKAALSPSILVSIGK